MPTRVQPPLPSSVIAAAISAMRPSSPTSAEATCRAAIMQLTMFTTRLRDIESFNDGHDAATMPSSRQRRLLKFLPKTRHATSPMLFCADDTRRVTGAV